MDVTVLIARILFASVFLAAALGHLTRTEATAGYVQSKGVPFPRPGVLGSGLLFLVGGLSVLLGVWPDLGALLLFITLVPTALLMHAFWKETDPTGRITEQTQFLKDLSLAGGALAMFALFAFAGRDLGLTVTGPLLRLT